MPNPSIKDYKISLISFQFKHLTLLSLKVFFMRKIFLTICFLVKIMKTYFLSRSTFYSTFDMLCI